MKKVFYLVAASLLMTSCLEDKAIEAYNEAFVSVFGNTDPLHTWKMVENQEVEVNLDKSSRVKIYVKLGSEYRLAADYENVSGTRTLFYDAPMGCEDIFVTVDGVPYQGGNSRSGNLTVESPTLSNEAVYKTFTYGEINTFHNDGVTLPEKKDNREKVTMGCKLISEGSGWYEFYPVYWAGAFHHGYGVYYYTPNENNKINIKSISFFTDHKAGGLIQRIDGDGTGDPVDVTDDYAYDYFFTKGNKYDNNQEVLKSQGYKFYLPPGTIFGFYVDITHVNPNDRGRFFSDPELNTVKAVSNFAFLHKDDKSYITVEDYDDNDYNDFIFILKGAHGHLVEEPVKYIYAVEDLGGAYDFDFNDVVFSVSHVAGKENATVQPLAAGGIYDAKIYFDNTPCCGGKEFHGMFGVNSVMVNTSAGITKDKLKKADPFLVKVSANWSHDDYQNFSVEVKLPSGNRVLNTYRPDKNNSAPQMLILSENWLWPTEKTSIVDAYQRFSEWTEDYKQNTWVNEPTEGKVVNWK